MRDMISCEEFFGLDADAVAAHGEDAWVADVTVFNGPADEDEDLVECDNCGTPWAAAQIFPATRVEWCHKCIKHDAAVEEERREREAAEEARVTADVLEAHLVGASNWRNTLPL